MYQQTTPSNATPFPNAPLCHVITKHFLSLPKFDPANIIISSFAVCP